ncbi:PREDICTED: methyl-CpG-binding domain-containing protein 13 isoform X2 [Tarenaya hassleriana]|nr:PREDICTED: methyl-CpG-binding domain-containing protein 13 isoform X2 [Tarenaya hassleriana]
MIRRKARKLRKDPLFIDPKSGYIFLSFKDASRYVRTGVIGNHARKPKENSHSDDDSGNGKILSLSVSTGDGSPGNSPEEKKINIYVRNSKRKSISSVDEHPDNCKTISKLSTTSSRVLQENAMEKEQKQDPTGRELIPCNENDTTIRIVERVGKRVTRSQAKMKKNEDRHELGGKSPSSLNLKSEDCNVSSKLKRASVSSQTWEEGSGKKGKAQDSTERKPISSSENTVTNSRVKQAAERRITRSQAKAMNDGKPELKRKTDLNDGLPQQASKRLELEPISEPKTRTRAVQALAVEQSDDERAGQCKELVLGGKPALDSCEMIVMPLSQAVTEKNEGHSSSLKQSSTLTPLVSERNNQEIDKKLEGHSAKNPNVAYDRKNKEMGSPRVSTRGRQAATAKFEEARNGKCEGASKSVAPADIYKQAREIPPSDGTTTMCRRSGRFSQSKPNTAPNSQRRNVIPLTWNQSEHPSKAEDNINLASVLALTEKNANFVSEPLSLDSTLADLWKDPCIAFAIKTLTGESLDLPNTAKVLTETKTGNAVDNHDEQRGVTFFPGIPKSSNMSNQRPGCSTELPVADIWKDPCIDFAIKTLTGAIPIGFDEHEGKPESTLPTTQAPKERQSDCVHSRQQHNSKQKAVSGGACFLPQQVDKSTDLRFSPSFSNGYN